MSDESSKTVWQEAQDVLVFAAAVFVVPFGIGLLVLAGYIEEVVSRVRGLF